MGSFYVNVRAHFNAAVIGLDEDIGVMLHVSERSSVSKWDSFSIDRNRRGHCSWNPKVIIMPGVVRILIYYWYVYISSEKFAAT